MAVEIFDVDGKNIEDTGMPGELVCTRPHPSMPVRFWGDDNDEKYRKAYFDTYPGKRDRCQFSVGVSDQRFSGVWRHADFIVKNPKTQGFIILGRRYDSFDLDFLLDLTSITVTASLTQAVCASGQQRSTRCWRNSASSSMIHSALDSVGRKTRTNASYSL